MCFSFALSQTRLDGLAVAFFALCLVLFFYVSYGSCPSYLQSCAPCSHTSSARHYPVALPLVRILVEMPMSQRERAQINLHDHSCTI